MAGRDCKIDGFQTAHGLHGWCETHSRNIEDCARCARAEGYAAGVRNAVEDLPDQYSHEAVEAFKSKLREWVKNRDGRELPFPDHEGYRTAMKDLLAFIEEA